MVCGVDFSTSRDKSEELEFSIDEKDGNAEIERLREKRCWTRMLMQLAVSKSEEEVDDEVMGRPALVPRGRRGVRGEGREEMAGGMMKSSALEGRGCTVVTHLCIYAK